MPRTADKTDIPQRLTQAGRDLFSRQGYNATGIQQITDQAGVPKGSFYHYFASKEAFGLALRTWPEGQPCGRTGSSERRRMRSPKTAWTRASSVGPGGSGSSRRSWMPDQSQREL